MESSKFCGLNPNPEAETSDWIPLTTAFAFSLETATTVGYGLPGNSSAFFQECSWLQTAIYFEMLTAMLFNAFLFAFFFARLARCENRGLQVVFADKATLRVEKFDAINPNKGNIIFEVQVYDVDRKHPLVDAHVRMYAINHNPQYSAATTSAACDSNNDDHCAFDFQLMRISNPNDELGGKLYTSLPHRVTHTIDRFSPLSPSSAKGARTPTFRLPSSGIVLREADAAYGNRDACYCPVCGESFNCWKFLEKHVSYNSILEKHDNVRGLGKNGKEGRHMDFDLGKFAEENRKREIVPPAEEKKPLPPPEDSIDEIRKHINFSGMEILVIVEATDPLMGGSFQALQSYVYDDIGFNCKHANCLVRGHTHSFRRKMLSGITVDLNRFHLLSSVALDGN